MIWRSNLDSCGEVECNPLIAQTSFTPRGLHCLAYLNRKVWLCLRESFGAVLVLELGTILRGCFVDELPYNFGVPDGKLEGLLLAVAEDDISE